MITTVAKPQAVPVERTSPLKLSEALRLGALKSPQAYRKFTSGKAQCAIATAAGILGVDWEDLVTLLRDAEVPLGDGRVPLDSALIYLNDDRMMPRPEIATWLESLGL